MKIPIWLQKLLGGRPMLEVEATQRSSDGTEAGMYMDCFGRLWYAWSRWSILDDRFRAGSESVETVKGRQWN